MAWNQPGGGGDKDPWGNRGGNDGGPPDLDEAFRKLKNKLRGIFGGKARSPLRSVGGGGGDGDGSGPLGGDGFNEKIAWGILALIALGWLASGFYIIDPPERGVVTRFGAYLKTTGPGPHWHLPWPIHSVETVNIERNRTLSLPTQLILTQDENLARVDLTVQYDIRDAHDFLFNVRRPEQTLNESIESVIREVVGRQNLDFVITEGRTELADVTRDGIQEIMDRYDSGINLQTVNLQQAQPPEQVQPAFEDAIMAREDRERIINEAQAVENELIPAARGDAARMREEAEAYRFRTVQGARGDVARFNAVLEEYATAPDVTRTRLYLDTLERVLGGTGKVMLAGDGDGSNLIYLPLDGLIGDRTPRGLDFEEQFGVQMPRGSLGAAQSEGSGSSLRGDRNRPTRGSN